MFQSVYNLFITIFIIIPAALVLLILLMSHVSNTSRLNKMKDATDKIYSFIKNQTFMEPDKVYIDCYGLSALAFNKSRTKILRIDYGHPPNDITDLTQKSAYVYDCSDIKRIEVKSNSKTTMKADIQGDYKIEPQGLVEKLARSEGALRELCIVIQFDYRMRSSMPRIATLEFNLFKTPYSVYDYNLMSDFKNNHHKIKDELYSTLHAMILVNRQD